MISRLLPLLLTSCICSTNILCAQSWYSVVRTEGKTSSLIADNAHHANWSTSNLPRKISKAAVSEAVRSTGYSSTLGTSKDEVILSSNFTRSTYSATNYIVSESPFQKVLSRKTAPKAPKQEGQQSIIKYAPLSSFGYEHVLGNNHSIYAGLSLYSLGFGASAVGLKAEYRFYGLIKSSPKQAPEGLWVAPTALLWRVSVDDFYETESAFVAQIGGIAGYQWIFNQKISLEPALGLSLTAVGSGSDTSLGAGVVPLFALRVGYVLK